MKSEAIFYPAGNSRTKRWAESRVVSIRLRIQEKLSGNPDEDEKEILEAQLAMISDLDSINPNTEEIKLSDYVSKFGENTAQIAWNGICEQLGSHASANQAN